MFCFFVVGLVLRLMSRNGRRLCVFEIAEVLEINYGAISYHLAKQRNAGPVSVEKYKMYLYYQLNVQALAAHREAARTIWGVPIPLRLLGGWVFLLLFFALLN